MRGVVLFGAGVLLFLPLMGAQSAPGQAAKTPKSSPADIAPGDSEVSPGGEATDSQGGPAESENDGTSEGFGPGLRGFSGFRGRSGVESERPSASPTGSQAMGTRGGLARPDGFSGKSVGRSAGPDSGGEGLRAGGLGREADVSGDTTQTAGPAGDATPVQPAQRLAETLTEAMGVIEESHLAASKLKGQIGQLTDEIKTLRNDGLRIEGKILEIEVQTREARAAGVGAAGAKTPEDLRMTARELGAQAAELSSGARSASGSARDLERAARSLRSRARELDAEAQLFEEQARDLRSQAKDLGDLGEDLERQAREIELRAGGMPIESGETLVASAEAGEPEASGESGTGVEAAVPAEGAANAAAGETEAAAEQAAPQAGAPETGASSTGIAEGSSAQTETTGAETAPSGAEGAPPQPPSADSGKSANRGTFVSGEAPDIGAIRAKLDRQLAEYRKRNAERRAKAKMRGFVDKAGALTLTNRAERYQNKRSQYAEVAIEYDPIVVPDRYRTRRSNQYSLGDLQGLISQYAGQYQVEESLLYAMIRVESNFDPYAVSPAGARGLMQLMPGTAAELGVGDIFDVAQNIAGGSQYIGRMLRLFEGDTQLALAGYNAGPEAVKKYGTIPPFRETQNYVRRVMIYSHAYARGGKPRTQLAKTRQPEASFTPDLDTKKYYVVRFRSGLTQPAEKVVDADPYYYVQYGGRIARIRKEHVKEIVAPA